MSLHIYILFFRTSSRHSRGGVANHDHDEPHSRNSKSTNGKKDAENAHDNDDKNGDGNESDDNVDEEVLPKGLIVWRDGIRQAQTSAQVAMGFYVLETAIAWHKSIMKAFCQLCHCGDNEDSLLLCDGYVKNTVTIRLLYLQDLNNRHT